MKILANIFTMLGAYVLAVSNYEFMPYCFMLIGALLWAYSAVKMRDNALLLLNAFYVVCNLIGIIKALNIGLGFSPINF